MSVSGWTEANGEEKGFAWFESLVYRTFRASLASLSWFVFKVAHLWLKRGYFVSKMPYFVRNQRTTEISKKFYDFDSCFIFIHYAYSTFESWFVKLYWTNYALSPKATLIILLISFSAKMQNNFRSTHSRELFNKSSYPYHKMHHCRFVCVYGWCDHNMQAVWLCSCFVAIQLM